MAEEQGGLSAPGAVAWALETFLAASPGWEHASFESLVGSLTGAQASWRRGPGRRSIWDYVRHMLHWRRCVLARLRGEPMPDVNDNWPAAPEPDDAAELERAWRAEVDDYRRVTEGLIAAVRDLDADEPHPHPALAHLPHWMGVVGMQVHDSYHLGQIALLRAMQGLEPVE
jgi:uncharacterized damage-inducible protein DinB